MEEKDLRRQNTIKQYYTALYSVCDEGNSLASLTLERMSATISLSVSSVFLPLPPPERWDWVSRMESNSWEGEL